MFEIDEILIDPSVPSLRFRCDLKGCRGACCTLPGGKGAPLLDEELEELRKAVPVVRKYLSEEHLAAIDQHGFVGGGPGEFVTTCVGQRACVFVTYEEGIAKCSLEKANFNGELSWRKPLSCHLFPLRVDRGLRDYLRFESLAQCQPALEHGQETDTSLSKFLKDALIRAYGSGWYRRFARLCRRQQSAENIPLMESGRVNA